MESVSSESSVHFSSDSDHSPQSKYRSDIDLFSFDLAKEAYLKAMNMTAQ